MSGVASADSAPLIEFERRLEVCESRARTVATNVVGEKSEAHTRVEAALLALPLLGCAILAVPEEWYRKPLLWRATHVGCTPGALCKTLILANAAGSSTDAGAPLWAQRYLAVVVQYTARLDLAALQRALITSAGGAACPTPVLSLAPGAEELTGFATGGMAPFGSRTSLPLIVARAALEGDAGPCLWLGGGEVALKLRVFKSQLRAAPRVVVLPVSSPREEAEWDGDAAAE